MKILSDFMIQILDLFFGLSGNYVLSIIFLTITINFALYPLTLQSIIQMSALQRIQPKIKKLQEKFKDKPKEMQKELSGLYKEEKVNPFGGCLPMLLKIPFFLALFFALQDKAFIAKLTSVGSAATLFGLNLNAPTGLGPQSAILCAIIVLSTYLSQKTMPAAKEQQMGVFSIFMPAFIGFISLSFPAGVQIYWIISNLAAVAQQVYIKRHRLPG